MARTSERLALVFSELASNALRHAAPPVVVRLSRTEGGWRISVDDEAGDGPSVRALDHSTPGGNGLHLVLTLADQAGWHTRGDGKRVWADVHDEPPEHLLGRLP
jgi:serine/threonine-protein kinase RsbW